MMQLPDLSTRRVLLGVSGGIAAYKSAELCRLLVRAGAQVQVMMTAAARRFVGEATFAALSGRLVATELFDPQQEDQIGHIRLADDAELMVLAPATADLIARLAHGLADDLVTTVYLAYTGPVLLAPAMNVHMWHHPATVANVEALRQRGHALVGPDSGDMACGHVGAGRMCEPAAILAAIADLLAASGAGCEPVLAGRRILVSAGPTREPIDPVRYIGNRSSGRMGYALAAAAQRAGATVLLVSGPSELAAPAGVQREMVSTAAEMASAIHQHARQQDAVIMAAAVADYRPRETSAHKIKKEQAGERLVLELERTEDILASLGADEDRPLLVGFAAETGADLDELARRKLAAKRCDLLVANDVLAADAGFEVATNRVVIYDPDGAAEAVPLMSKDQVAGRIIERVARLLGDRARRSRRG